VESRGERRCIFVEQVTLAAKAITDRVLAVSVIELGGYQKN
jgi:hypothetical protein